MSLTDAQKTKIEEWIASRAPKMSCPACGGKNWGIQNDLGFISIIDPKTTRVSRESGFPVAVLTCNACGFTSLFSAVQIGIMGQE
jgi:hypothetical protein